MIVSDTSLADFSQSGDFLPTSTNPQFALLHRLAQNETLSKDLKQFLEATIDEVRLHYAERAAHATLALTDIDDSRYFRKAVLLRELKSTMGYEKQRDHAAHTVHNYLLGWFIVLNSSEVRTQAKRQFAMRFDEECVEQNFMNLWAIPSLLHDIGYLFEGSSPTSEFSLGNESALMGAKYANEFFKHHFWEATEIKTAADKRCVLWLAQVAVPSISGNSIIEIADALRELPSVNHIQSKLRECIAARNISSDEAPRSILNLESDAFSLWEENYRFFGNTTMAERVVHLRTAYETLLTDGLPKAGIRVLDHGVCGALLQLQVSAFWFEVYLGLRKQIVDLPRERSVIATFCDKVEQKVKIDVNWFWGAIVWSTAAVAFHNIAQIGKQWPGAPETIDLRIRIEDDVVTYLGILVDVLEEWDRYSMHRNSVFTGAKSLPLQSKDVGLGVGTDGRIIVVYPDIDIANKVQKSLDQSLLFWRTIVEIRPTA